jgi:autotransporter-associated beta strand protein
MKPLSTRSSLKEFRSTKRVGAFLAVFVVGLTAYGVYIALAANQFWNTNGANASWTANNWGTTAPGPFTNGWTANNDANFTASSAITYVSLTNVGNINVANSSTVNVTGAGTFTTGGAVRAFDVGTGSVLDFGTQSFSNAAGTGLVKNGAGTIFLSNGSGSPSLPAGFTLNAGTIVLGGTLAMGTNALTVNGGTLAANINRTFTGRFTSFTIGGDFTMGGVTAGVASGNGSATANISIDTNASLGASTRTITIGSNGTYTLAGIISGNAGSGLTITNASGATGKLALTNANTYTGDTTINGGTLVLSGSGSIANSPNIVLAGGATFDVSGRTGGVTLGGTQTLKATGSGATGTINTGANGLTFGTTSSLQFTAYNGTNAPLIVGGSGTLSLASTNPVTVNTTSALGVGDYTLIAKAGTAAVAGTAPTSLTIGGSGLASGMAATLQITGGQLILRVASAGALQFSSATYSLGEGGGSVALNVTRTGGSASPVSVNYSTSNGTAAAGSDYTAQSSTLTWAAGDATDKTIVVPVTDDAVYEGNESFGVALNSPTGGATLGTISSATVTIVENEAVPSVSVGAVTVAEPSSGITYATFPVTLSGVSALTTTVNFATADGTATAPGDYTATSGTVTFAPGETAKTVAVIVKADDASEPSETFTLNLSSPSNATISDGTGVATITQPVAAGQVIISEFRLSGPGDPNAAPIDSDSPTVMGEPTGATSQGGDDAPAPPAPPTDDSAGAPAPPSPSSPETDEFIELYNNTDADITVMDASPLTCVAQINVPLLEQCGWTIVDLQGSVSSIPRVFIPEGTVIAARGHLLLASTGYSLSALAAPDVSYTPPAYNGGEADYTGLVLSNTADRAQFTQPSFILDAVGFEGVALPFREGTGLLPAAGVASSLGLQHSFVRNQPSSRPTDTGDNRADFTLVATTPTLLTDGTAVLGAPAPENSASLISRNSGFSVSVPPGAASSLRSNATVTNGSLGTLSLRRRFTNNTGQALSKLRFRVVQVTTYNSKQVFANQAEVRVLDAQLTGLPNTIKATAVETPPQQTSGGGVNTGLLVGGSLTLAQPLQNGQSVDVEFLLGVMRSGSYQFILVVEGGQ